MFVDENLPREKHLDILKYKDFALLCNSKIHSQLNHYFKLFHHFQQTFNLETKNSETKFSKKPSKNVGHKFK